MDRIPFIEIEKIVQEKYYYCGQACMKMFDSEINQSQDELWEITQMNSKEPEIWYTDPIGLLNGIKDVSDNQVRINVFPDSLNKECLVKSLVSSLCSNKPILVPSRSGAHWVIINGVNTNEKEDITGIFVVDPWKGMPGKSLFVFGNFFFESFFSKIRFAGEWSKKRIAIISNYINDTLPFNILLQDELGGGSMVCPDSLTKEDIYEACCFNFKRLGLGTPQEVKAGGLLSDAITIRDISANIKYRITPLELNGDIVWSIVNLNTLLVETVCFSDELVFYSYKEVEEALANKYPDSKVEVYEEAIFDCKSPNLMSIVDFVYKCKIDDKPCFVKAQDFTIIYDLATLMHPKIQTSAQF